MSQQSLEKGTIKLCGTQGCCPVVDFTDTKNIVIRDDFGGHVRLTLDQWQDLKTRFTRS